MDKYTNKIWSHLLKRKIGYVITFCIFIATFFYEDKTFHFGKLDFCQLVLYWLAKAFIIIFFIGISEIFYHWLNLLKTNRKKAITMGAVFSVAFLLYLAFLIITSPGLYGGDAVYILKRALVMEKGITAQGMLTAVLYIASIMVFPFPVAVPLAQCILIVMAFTYIVVESIDLMDSFFGLLMILPLFLPIIIIYNLLPMRAALVACLLMLIIFETTKLVISRRVKTHNLVILALAIAALSTWRFDAIPLVLIIPICLLIIFRKQLTKKNTIIILFLPIVFFVLFKIPGKLDETLGMDSSARIIMLTPLSQMLQYDLDGPRIEQNLATLNNYVSLDNLKQYPSAVDSIAIYEAQGTLKFEGNPPISKALIAYADIVLHNPIVFLRSRIETFNITNKTPFLFVPFEEYTEEICVAVGAQKETASLLTPPYPKARMQFFNSLYCKQLLPLMRLYLPIAVAFILFLAGFITIKKRFGMLMVFCGGVQLLQAAIIFLTTPNIWIMYYIPTILCGYMSLSLFVAIALKQMKIWITAKKNNGVTQ